MEVYMENNEYKTVRRRPKRKRGGCLKQAILIGGAIFILGFCGAMILDPGEEPADETTEQTDEGTTETATYNEETTYSIGEAVDVGGLSVTVNGKSNQVTVGNEFLNETAGSGNYLLLDITITNNGNEAVTVDDSNFKLIKGETTFKSDGTATIYVNDESASFFLNQLNPESTLSGIVAFDISKESANDRSEERRVSGGFFSGDKELININ